MLGRAERLHALDTGAAATRRGDIDGACVHDPSLLEPFVETEPIPERMQGPREWPVWISSRALLNCSPRCAGCARPWCSALCVTSPTVPRALTRIPHPPNSARGSTVTTSARSTSFAGMWCRGRPIVARAVSPLESICTRHVIAPTISSTVAAMISSTHRSPTSVPRTTPVASRTATPAQGSQRGDDEAEPGHHGERRDHLGEGPHAVDAVGARVHTVRRRVTFARRRARP